MNDNAKQEYTLRPDLALIAGLIEPHTRVLDIGCGNGELLAHLVNHKQVDARGIEISIEGVRKTVAQGLSVIQGDADEDMKYYPDKAFDYAILSHTIQATENPRLALEQLVRISRTAIVSIPNFAFWRNRLHLMFKGGMPVTPQLPYEWYETPNIHFCTILDFIKLCEKLGFKIERKFVLSTNKQPVEIKGGNVFLSNLLSEQAVFLVKG